MDWTMERGGERVKARGWGATARWAGMFLLLAAAAVYPALRENVGALSYDAGTVHLYRSFVFSGAISDGALYPRWVQFLHGGLGSPLFTFNPPLPYYALDVLYRLGIPHPVGWRLLIALGLLAAAGGAYLLVHLLTGRRWPALVAGVAYLYAPYVLRNALERGSLETYSMFLYPWVLWALLWLARRPGPGRFVVAALVWAACIACHVLGPLMLAPVALILAAAAGWRYRTALPLLALLAGGLLTAAIWLPIAPEQANVRLDLDFGNPLATPLRNPLPLDALLGPPVVYDVQRGNNGSGDIVGLVQVVLLALGVPATVYAWVRRRRDLALYLGAATLVGVFLFWMLTGASDFVWRAFEPVLTRLEFRSRWMGLQALAAATVAGLLVALVSRRWQRLVGPALAVALIAAALPSLYIGLLHRYGTFGDTLSWGEVRAAEASSGLSAFTSWNEFAPRWRTAPFGQELGRELGGSAFDPAKQPLAGPAGVRVLAADVRSASWDLDLAADQAGPVTLHLLYYPRWQATVDGQGVAVRPEPKSGYVQVDLPAGTHRLALRYGTTPAEVAGLAISGLTLLGLAVAVWRGFARRRRANTAGREAAGGVDPAPEVAPSWWLLGGLALLLAVKAFYVDPATTALRCVSGPERVCGAQATASIPFGGGPRLRGYAVPSYSARPGGELRVNLVWQGEAGARPKLQSFVHLRNGAKDRPMNPRSGSEIWAQVEHETPAGLFSEEFQPGMMYVDEFRVRLPEDIPAGSYFLEVGWFDPATGEQLDPEASSVQAPLRVLWRSILLPDVQVTGR